MDEQGLGTKENVFVKDVQALCVEKLKEVQI